MIKKIYICSSQSIIAKFLRNSFYMFNNVEIVLNSTEEFMYSQNFDIINLPTSFLAEFDVIPGDLNCVVVDTKHKYNLPRYVVSSPNFKNSPMLSDIQCAQYQITSPFETALNFSNKLKKGLIYAIHTEYSFSYLSSETQNLIIQCNFLKDILHKTNM